MEMYSGNVSPSRSRIVHHETCLGAGRICQDTKPAPPSEADRSKAAPRDPYHQAAFEDALERLRAFCGDREFGMRGHEAIAAYLKQLGVLTGRGQPVSASTVRRWIKRR